MLGARYFLFFSLLSNRYQAALSLGVQRPGCEADFHLVPKSKNAWSYTSALPYVFMAWCLVKHRDNFTFLSFSYCDNGDLMESGRTILLSFRFHDLNL
jgi:hypothetical protein